MPYNVLLYKKNVGPYTLDGHTLDRDHHHSYLGLKWASHVAQVSSSAKQTLGVIWRNFRHTVDSIPVTRTSR